MNTIQLAKNIEAAAKRAQRELKNARAASNNPDLASYVYNSLGLAERQLKTVIGDVSRLIRELD